MKTSNNNALRAVLWKNFHIRKHHWVTGIFETVIPVFSVVLVVYARSTITEFRKHEITNVTYNEKVLLSYNYHQINLEETMFFYAPADQYFSDIVYGLQEKLQIINNNIMQFKNEEVLLKEYTLTNASTVIAIIFNSEPGSSKLDYTIRYHQPYCKWRTNKLYEDEFTFQPGKGSDYNTKGFLTLQKAIDMSFIEKEAEALGRNIPEVVLEVEEFPYPPYNFDTGCSVLLVYLPVITMFSFLFIGPIVLQRVVEEKYTGIKELMHMKGMKLWVRWFSWFTYGMIPMTISVLIIVALLKVDVFHAGSPPIEFSDFTILALFLILYCIASTVACFLLSTLFHKPAEATLAGILAWNLSYFVPTYIIDKSLKIPFYMQFCIMFLPNMTLQYGFSAISQYETRKLGIQWSNWHLPGGGSSEEITMLHTCIMLVVDSIVYFTLTLYLDAIMPGKYGIPQPKLFPLKFIKSCFTRSKSTTEYNDLEDVLFEACQNAIEFHEVSKIYGKRTVVDNLSMAVRKNQITVLLGHNGAGKSTIMNIITGMTRTTSGQIYINDKEILNSSDLSQSIGLCPQHNMFFWDLTVWQHMMFFAMIRGLSSTHVKSEIDHLLKILNLHDKQHEYPHTLSGGMQRKLCLAIAVIGDPEILILDEPSSGMDSQSRREMWDLLLEWRKRKTILITTHFMEEADALADHTIIINEGRMKCSGTPMQLKSNYGCGSILTLLIKNNKTETKETARIIENHWSERLTLKRIDGNEIQFTIKEGSKAELFKQLEESREELEIVNISYRNTNLEDVFIRTLSTTDENNMIPKADNIKILQSMQKKSPSRWLTVAVALYYKRWQFAYNQILFYVIPVVVMFLAAATFITLGQNIKYLNKREPAMTLSLKTYGSSTVMAHSTGTEEDFEILKYYGDLVEDVGSVFVEKENVLTAIIDEGIRNLPYYQHHIIAATEFSNIDSSEFIKAVALYNNLAIHSAPISGNLITNTIAKYLLGQNYSIVVNTHPLASIHTLTTDELSENQMGLLWLTIMPIGFLLLLGSFIYFPFTELSTNFARIQYICGATPFSYWINMFLFDFATFLIIVPFTMIPIFACSPFRGIHEIGSLYIILACYGMCGIPFSYLFSRKKTFSGAYALFVIIGNISGLMMTVIVFALENSGKKNFEQIGTMMKGIFMVISPQFGLTYCGVNFSMKVVRNYNFEVMDDAKRFSVCNTDSPPACCKGESLECDLERSYLDPSMWLMGIGTLIFLAVNIQIDHAYFVMTVIKKLKECLSLKRHSDREINNNQTEEPSNKSLKVKKLTKIYGNKKVVKDINLTMNKGECVGILGENGAGKSTIFRMLMKEELRNTGTIQIDDINIDENTYLKKLSYCPQNNALNKFLTGRQILRTIARLRDISDNKIVKDFIDIIGLTDIADMPCYQYSGGNKRKLNFAMALIGLPEFNLMDEPTNGVDPLSKRTLWTLIDDIRKTFDMSIILTSHSMDECEALCNKINIMKEGEIINNGTISELKNKMVGFNVKIKLKACSEELIEVLKESISKQIGVFDIIDEHSGLLHLFIKPAQKKWSYVFKKFDEFKFENGSAVECYEISDASLEQIFLATVTDGTTNNRNENNFLW